MKLFQKKKVEEKEVQRDDLAIYDPKDIYLLTTQITSDYNDGSGAGPICVTQYYLATKENEKYYELFSKVEITYEDNSTPGFTFGEFNTPMIELVEKLEKYVKDPNKKLSAKELFYFITMKNTELIISGDLEEE